MDKLLTFKSLHKLFKENGYSLYLVGGTVRDFLLGLELNDYDVVTNATPKDMETFLENANYTFAKYGSVKLHYQNIKFDITTLRKEEGYLDSRHPNKIVFCDSLEDDSKRRDFTINALYMNKDLEVIDLVGGQKDIERKVIRMIGNPLKRIEEDPLRIIRIYRFELETGFEIEKELQKTLEENFSKVNLLNKEKVMQEIRKSSHPDELRKILKSHGIFVD